MTQDYIVKLPADLGAEAERLSRRDGIGVDAFVLAAIAEKLAVAANFEARRKRADRAAFRRILDRDGGEPPRPGDARPPAE